tara:strand:+ start:122 stop:943 length:822 start_codon:yes stop_codon:yes gene_type:complete
MEETYHTIENDGDTTEKAGVSKKNLSVLLPAKIQLIAFCYNNMEFLEGFFESLVNQTLGRFDICIIDIGSTDGSYEFIDKWVPTRPGIVIRQQRANKLSPFAAYNKATLINLIKNEEGWICPVNIGDRFSPGALKTYLGYLETFPDTDIFYGNFRIVNDKEHKNIVGLQDWPEYSREALIENNFCGCSPLIKGKTLVELGGFDVNMGYVADHELYIRMAEEDKKFHRVEEVIGKHYEEDEKDFNEEQKKLTELFKKQTEDLKELRRSPSYNKS